MLGIFINIDLPTLVQIISTISFTVLTLWIILQNRKTINLMAKDRERPTIKEIVQIIIAPSISKLETEINDLHGKEYGWSHQRKSMDNISALMKFTDRRYIILLNDLLRKYPELNKKVNEHDALVSALNEKLAELDERIDTKEFREKCCRLINEYNSRINELGAIYKNPSVLQESDYHYILKCVVNGIPHIGTAYIQYVFWEEYGEILLKERERKDTKEVANVIEERTNNLISCSKSLKDDLVGIKENYRKKYSLLVSETEGKPKNLRMKLTHQI